MLAFLLCVCELWQTVKTQMKWRIKRHFINVFIFRQMRERQIFFKIINCYSSIYTNDHLKYVASNHNVQIKQRGTICMLFCFFLCRIVLVISFYLVALYFNAIYAACFCRLLILVCELVFAVSMFIAIVLRLFLFVWVFKGFFFKLLSGIPLVFNSLKPDQARSNQGLTSHH